MLERPLKRLIRKPESAEALRDVYAKDEIV